MLGPGRLLASLRAGGLLLSRPDGLFCRRGRGEGLVPGSLGGAYLLAGPDGSQVCLFYEY
jgi:hypothetical protein